SRRFVVTDIRRTSLPIDPLLNGLPQPQHLITLSSVEDDALGEELQVIWELEPGAQAFERMELPEPSGFDEPARLDAFLDAVRWGAASSAEMRMLQSPFRSGIEIEDYQLDPVVRAIQMPRVNLLIADDVGLGKTIEAGLVLQELVIRHRVRRALIICPASLQIQWQEQMRDKFGLEFRIIDGDAMKRLRRTRGIHVNPWSHYPRLITSIDFFKREQPLRLFRATLPHEGELKYPRRYDLLIVDEAHNVAPSATGAYAIDSLRTAAVRLIADHFEHRLFLTATPHNGYSESFTALLELLDPQRFARGIPPDRRQLQAVMVRRLKRELPARWDGTPRFPERKLEALSVAYTEQEQRIHRALKAYTASRTSEVSDAIERYATEFVLKLLKKRLFSSPAAFITTLDRHELSLKESRRRKSAPIRPSQGILKAFLGKIDEDYADDDAYEEATADAVTITSPLFRPPTAEETGYLKEMRDWAEQASVVADSKAHTLLSWLETNLRPNHHWTDNRVIIFTEYRATQKWLHQILANEGYARDERLMLLFGGMDAQDRERVKAAFQTAPDISPVRILLATDAASEGLDLQNFCSNLIHYEIPWNPNRMEQRNGRIDRHGQRASEVKVFHFVGSQFRSTTPSERVGDIDGDLEFLFRAALKVETIREDLGKVGPVIAQQVEEAMLGHRHRLDTSRAEQESEPVRKLFKFERKLREQIAEFRDQLYETRQTLRLSPENIRDVVLIALELAGQPPLAPVSVPGLAGPAYRVPGFKGSWSACLEGLAHPHTLKIRPIVFDPELAIGRDDVVLAHLNHRLVQMCLRLLRAEVWSSGSTRRLNRVTARVATSPVLESPAVVAYGRLVVLGGDQQRLHEEVIVAGGIIREGRFNRFNVGQTQAVLETVTDELVPAGVHRQLAGLWPTIGPGLLAALERR
ncbi:MAG TPA: DISARM system SNF2-like helicase DrmD, partial [Acidobacteriota bacterium]|nr:DISARM system SNF2-like helicase DrmD [Acidobacteriota bacterium]